jgi:putative ABC transport system ATP-binding protein
MIIELQDVSKVYRTETIETMALSEVNLSIEKGEVVSVMGPSGCGKSTLLNIIGMLDAPSEGTVRIEGTQVERYNGKAAARFRNEKLGFVFQSFHLIPDLAVIDNVELPLIYRGMSARQRREMSEEALVAVGLKNRMKHFPGQLSGGQKQRVAIARAIVGRPAIILADEPTGNLDSVMGNEIMGILLRLNREQHTTIVMVTHDEAMARKTHRLIRLYDGKQIA